MTQHSTVEAANPCFVQGTSVYQSNIFVWEKLTCQQVVDAALSTCDLPPGESNQLTFAFTALGSSITYDVVNCVLPEYITNLRKEVEPLGVVYLLRFYYSNNPLVLSRVYGNPL